MTSGSADTRPVYALREVAAGVTVGVDEVGRGAWAGPVSVGAVIADAQWEGLLSDGKGGFRDSKMWSERRRQEVFIRLIEAGMRWSVGHATPREVDVLGLNPALALAGRRALFELGVLPRTILLDGCCDYFRDVRVITQRQGDRVSAAIAAASICAKVARDAVMTDLGVRYPDWGFETSKGYGTLAHSRRLCASGPLGEHRKSVKPVARAVREAPVAEGSADQGVVS